MSSWMIPYSNLDPNQENIVRNSSSKSLWLIGYPGSGKSVVLTHIADKRTNDNASVAVVTYTKTLGDLFGTGFNEIDSSSIPVLTPHELLRKQTKFYDYIICDEIQDLSKQTLLEIKNRCRYLVAAGDANQSIYEKDMFGRPVMSTTEARAVLGVEPIEQNLIYRLTNSIINCVMRICPSLYRMKEKIDATKVDVRVVRRKFPSVDEECKWLYNDAKKHANNERVAFLFSTHNMILDFINKLLSLNGYSQWTPQMNSYGKTDYSSLNSCLNRCNIPICCIVNGYGSLESATRQGKIIFTTFHSSKGLDFENVYIPLLNQGYYITSNEERSKTLMMVAMTRSSKNLTLSYTGSMFDYIKNMDCIDVNMTNQSQNDDDDDPFA